jgi:beta-glucoside operon transcriptional antiterminator
MLDRGSANYERLLTQLENMLQTDESGRLLNELNPELVTIARMNFPEAYTQACEIGEMVEEDYGYAFTESQLVMIAMEINRIDNRLNPSMD